MQYVLFYLSARSSLASRESIRRNVSWACDKLSIPRAAVLIGDLEEDRQVPVYARYTRPSDRPGNGALEATYNSWKQALPPIPPVVTGAKPRHPWSHKKIFQYAKRHNWPLTPIFTDEVPQPTPQDDSEFEPTID